MGVANPLPQELTGSPQGDTILTGASWGEQLDAVAPLTDPNEHEASPLSEHGGIVGVDSDSGRVHQPLLRGRRGGRC